MGVDGTKPIWGEVALGEGGRVDGWRAGGSGATGGVGVGAVLPVTEVGPVDFWALRRLASIRRSVDISVARVSELRSVAGEPKGYPACPTLRIEGRFRGFGGE